MHTGKQLLLHDALLHPLVLVDHHALVSEGLLGELDAVPSHILVEPHPAARTLHGSTPMVHAVHDPVQHAHVLAVARPDELAVLIFAKPVDPENARRVVQLATDLEPMSEILGHVIASERQHGKWIAAHLADLAERSR